MRGTNLITGVLILCRISDLAGLVEATPFGRKDGGLRIPFKTLRKVDSRDETLESRARAPGFTWGVDPMRGVNIGGWLVVQPSNPLSTPGTHLRLVLEVSYPILEYHFVYACNGERASDIE